MAFSYNPPAADGTFQRPLDEVRFLTVDTTEPGQLDDATLLYFLGREEGSARRAAAAALNQRAANYIERSKTTKAVGDLNISKDYSAIASALQARADELADGGGAGGTDAMPFSPLGLPAQAGPVFYIGMMDR